MNFKKLFAVIIIALVLFSGLLYFIKIQREREDAAGMWELFSNSPSMVVVPTDRGLIQSNFIPKQIFEAKYLDFTLKFPWGNLVANNKSSSGSGESFDFGNGIKIFAIGDGTLKIDYNSIKYILETIPPSQIEDRKSDLLNVLNLKWEFISSETKKTIYFFKTIQFKGIQIGTPEEGANVKISLFDDNNIMYNLEIIGAKQEEIDYVISSIK